MKRRSILVIIAVVILLIITGCSYDKKEEKSDSLRFKEEYESINDEVIEGTDYKVRSLNIPEDNPIVYAEANDIISMMDNNETFVVYFGFNSCPWCRSVLPILLDVASDLKLEKIYYKGSKSKWEKIKKPRDWANGLPKNCKIIYNNSEEDFVWDISESVLTPFEIVKENRYMIGFKGVEDEKLVIPERFEKNGSGYKVVSIGDYAFMGCTNLVDIKIPNTVIAIRDCAFADCSKLTSIEIPNSVIELHDEVFGGCSCLETIYYRGSESDWNAIKKAKGWADGIPKNCKVIYNYKG